VRGGGHQLTKFRVYKGRRPLKGSGADPRSFGGRCLHGAAPLFLPRPPLNDADSGKKAHSKVDGPPDSTPWLVLAIGALPGPAPNFAGKLWLAISNSLPGEFPDYAHGRFPREFPKTLQDPVRSALATQPRTRPSLEVRNRRLTNKTCCFFVLAGGPVPFCCWGRDRLWRVGPGPNILALGSLCQCLLLGGFGVPPVDQPGNSTSPSFKTRLYPLPMAAFFAW